MTDRISVTFISSRVVMMSGNEDKIKSCLSVAYGGYMDNDNSTEDTYDPRYINDNSVRKHYSSGEYQKTFYEERRIEIKENPYYSGFVDYVTNRLSAGIYFTGDGAEACNNFFKKTCLDGFMQLRLAIRSAVANGTGFQRFYFDKKGNLRQIVTADHEDFTLRFAEEKIGEEGTEVDEFKRLQRVKSTNQTSKTSVDAKYIEITDDNSYKSYYMKNYNRMGSLDYQVEGGRLGLLRLIYSLDEPYGEPVGEASYMDLKAMKRLNRNIMAGIERNLSETIKIGLDLDAYDDDEKEAKITEANTNWKGIDWNAIDSFAHDKRVDIGRLGTYPGDGTSNTDKMLQPGAIIEPVLSSILFSYYVAIGLVEQTGANKSLIAAQKKEAERGIQMLRDSVKAYFYSQIKPLITNKDVEMRYRPDLDSEDIVNLFSSGIITREYAQDSLGIVDDGDTYLENTQVTPEPVSGSSSDSNDDNPTNRRLGGQSKGAGK